MDDLVWVMSCGSSMEAELAKNYLEAQGIYAAITTGEEGVVSSAGGEKKRYGLAVLGQDADKARALLESQVEGEPGTVTEEDKEAAANYAVESEAAQKEFDLLRVRQLEQKAGSVKSNAVAGITAFFAGIAAVLIIPNKNSAVRIGAACLIFAVIQYFVWKDAVKARNELEDHKKRQSNS